MHVHTRHRSMLRAASLAVVMLPAVLATGGCRPTSTSVSCTASTSAGASCTITWTWGSSQEMFDGSFDASSANIDLSGSDVAIQGVGGTVTLTAADGGAVLGQMAAPVAFYGSTVYFADPGAVDAWVAAHGGTDVDFSLDLGGITVASHAGSNTFAADIEYQGQVVGGGSHSWTRSGGGGGPPTQQQ